MMSKFWTPKGVCDIYHIYSTMVGKFRPWPDRPIIAFGCTSPTSKLCRHHWKVFIHFFNFMFFCQPQNC